MIFVRILHEIYNIKLWRIFTIKIKNELNYFFVKLKENFDKN
jgi:hypothetical protein